jgi:uncharacterized protein
LAYTLRTTLLITFLGVLAGWPQFHEDTSGLEQFFGFYEVSPGRVLYIQPNSELDGQLMAIDDGLQIRALRRESQNSFIAGPSFRIFDPPTTKLNFIRKSDGGVAGLEFARMGSPTATARRLNLYTQKEVRFRNGPTQLAGTLLVPNTSGPHPGIVLIHGSGPADRYTALFLSLLLRELGIAVLGYDKRGVGESTGDWRQATLTDLAEDAIAAVRFLKARSEIDSKRIGVFGGSQGGWIAPLAATRSSDVRFVISMCGPAVSPAEQELDRVGNQLAVRGFPKTDVEQAIDLMKLRDNFVRGRISWQEFQSAVGEVKQAKWLSLVPIPSSEESPLLTVLRNLPMDYDPIPTLQKLRVPTLALFGELDLNVLAEKNSKLWANALKNGGNRDVAIRILKNARHGLLEVKTGSDAEVPNVRRAVPEYRTALVEWLSQHRIPSQALSAHVVEGAGVLE